MDYYIDNIDEETARQQRRQERLERMRREKRRQMRRRRKMKLLMKRSAGILAIVLVMAISITAFGRKPKEEFSIKTESQETTNKKSWFIFGKNKQEEATAQDDFSMEATMQTESEIVQEIEEEPEVVTLADKEAGTYNFDATSTTKSIYNENIISSHAILIDETTDTIIASKGARERISPASMTKVLTILVAAENITKEQLDDTFVMTREITDYGYVNDCSSVGFLDGEEITELQSFT